MRRGIIFPKCRAYGTVPADTSPSVPVFKTKRLAAGFIKDRGHGESMAGFEVSHARCVLDGLEHDCIK